MSHLGTGGLGSYRQEPRHKNSPTRTGEKESDWYHGTADAVRRNIDYLTHNWADEVVILSGDHIYRMDFDAMIEYHRSKKADVTVAMMAVPKSQIHQFGAGIVDRNDGIVDWEEKPKEAKTNCFYGDLCL